MAYTTSHHSRGHLNPFSRSRRAFAPPDDDPFGQRPLSTNSLSTIGLGVAAFARSPDPAEQLPDDDFYPSLPPSPMGVEDSPQPFRSSRDRPPTPCAHHHGDTTSIRANVVPPSPEYWRGQYSDVGSDERPRSTAQSAAGSPIQDQSRQPTPSPSDTALVRSGVNGWDSLLEGPPNPTRARGRNGLWIWLPPCNQSVEAAIQSGCAPGCCMFGQPLTCKVQRRPQRQALTAASGIGVPFPASSSLPLYQWPCIPCVPAYGHRKPSPYQVPGHGSVAYYVPRPSPFPGHVSPSSHSVSRGQRYYQATTAAYPFTQYQSWPQRLTSSPSTHPTGTFPWNSTRTAAAPLMISPSTSWAMMDPPPPYSSGLNYTRI